LQDRPDGAAGPAAAVGCGSGQRNRGGRRDTASSSRGGWRAICESCRGRLGDTRHRGRAFAGGSGCGVVAGTTGPSRRSAPGEIETVGTAYGKNGNTDGPSLQGQRCAPEGTSPCKETRNWKRIESRRHGYQCVRLREIGRSNAQRCMTTHENYRHNPKNGGEREAKPRAKPPATSHARPRAALQ